MRVEILELAGGISRLDTIPDSRLISEQDRVVTRLAVFGSLFLKLLLKNSLWTTKNPFTSHCRISNRKTPKKPNKNDKIQFRQCSITNTITRLQTSKRKRQRQQSCKPLPQNSAFGFTKPKKAELKIINLSTVNRIKIDVF